MTVGETHRAIEATFRIERARLIAGLVRVVRNVDLAEELAQDALVVALSEWPRIGVPANPGAWLMALAKRRAIDALRRDKMRERKHEEIARTLDETFDGAVAAIEAALDDDLGDETSRRIGRGRPITVCEGPPKSRALRRVSRRDRTLSCAVPPRLWSHGGLQRAGKLRTAGKNFNSQEEEGRTGCR